MILVNKVPESELPVNATHCCRITDIQGEDSNACRRTFGAVAAGPALVTGTAVLRVARAHAVATAGHCRGVTSRASGDGCQRVDKTAVILVAVVAEAIGGRETVVALAEPCNTAIPNSYDPIRIPARSLLLQDN